MAEIYIISKNWQCHDGDGWYHWVLTEKQFFHKTYKAAKLHVRILLKGNNNKAKFAQGTGRDTCRISKKIYEIEKINLLD